MDVAALGPSDAEDAAALWEACGLTRPWNDAAADFARAVDGPSSAVLGVREAGVVRGTAMIGRAEPGTGDGSLSQHGTRNRPLSQQGELLGTAMVGHDGHRGWVYYLAVSPDAQGNGLGRRLMAACEQWLVTRGVPKIQFMVRTDNTTVLDFYAHLGYALQDVVVLGRRLD